MDKIAREEFPSKMFSLPLSICIYSKGKELAPTERIPFPKMLDVQKS